MRRKRYVLRLTIQILCVQCMAVATIAVAAWAAGRLLSDNCLCSQWLLWIPTPVMLPTVILGIVSSLGPGRKTRLRRRRLHAWLICTAAIAAYFCFIEHRIFRSAPDPVGGVSIAHWNMTHGRTREQREYHLEQVVDLLSDITILVEAWGLRQSIRNEGVLPDDVIMRNVGRFCVLTRLPLIETRTLVANNTLQLALIRVDCRETLGRELAMYIVDLPSDPTMSKADLAAKARELIDEAEGPDPDIVVGDCNMTRGSASLAALVPGMHHAFDDGGHGYGATFHRRFPLYHIDHILLGEDLNCNRYDIIDPGIGRHRAQRAYLSPAE